MRLGMIQGKKAEQDMIQLIKCDCGNDYAPTYPWLAELLVRLIKNEGLIYKEKHHQGQEYAKRYFRWVIENVKVPNKEEFELK